MKQLKIFILDHRTYCINSLGDSLAQLGHKIYFQSADSLDLVEAGIAHFKPEVLITVGYNRNLFNKFKPGINQLCLKYKLFHIYWATEDKINYHDWSLPYVLEAKPNLIWTIHPGCIDLYNSIGYRAMYFNFAFNPRVFPEKKANDKEIYDITFIGATHLFKETYRFESLRHLVFPFINSQYKVDVWGTGWKKDKEVIEKAFGLSLPKSWLHGHLLYGNTSEIYRKSKIVLGVQNATDQVTQRTFEILGTGGFMIASKTSALSDMFEDKKELVLSSSPQETLELVKYYLNKPDLRFEIGQRARNKVLQGYTYEIQLNKIWPQVTEVYYEFKAKEGEFNAI